MAHTVLIESKFYIPERWTQHPEQGGISNTFDWVIRYTTKNVEIESKQIFF